MSVFDNIDPLEFDEAKILVTQIDKTPHIIFKGIIDNPYPEKFITPFLDKIHNQLIESNQTILICNMKSLDFINSSGLKCFVNWILNLKKIEKTKQYKIVLLLNPSESWQKKSFSVISLLYKDHIKIE